MDAGRVRLLPRRYDGDRDWARVWEARQGDRAHHQCDTGVPSGWGPDLRAHGRPLRAASAVDDRPGLLLRDTSAVRVGTDVHQLSGAAGAVRHRYGRRVGCGRVAGDGKGAAQVARAGFGIPATGVRRRLPAGRAVLLLRLSE